MKIFLNDSFSLILDTTTSRTPFNSTRKRITMGTIVGNALK